MGIYATSVRRGITVGMIYLIVTGFGLFGLTQLQLDLFPDISFPTVIVITSYTGASPEDIETLVTRPIEGAVASVKDVKEVHSTSKNGASVVEVRFEWGKDMEQAETDVRRALEFSAGLMPEDAEDSLVFAFDPSLQPVVMMTVSGPYPLDELRRIAVDDIQPRLERLPGIASSEVAGGLEREIHVLLDPATVTAHGLDVNTIVGAIYRENLKVPGGSLVQGAMDFTIQTYGKYASVAEIGEVVVGAAAGPRGPVPLRLKEVARIEDSFVDSERVLEVDNVPAVWILVRKQSGANTVKAAEAVLAALPEIKRQSAAEIDFKIIFDQSEYINLAIGNLSSTAWMGIIITFLVLWVFLRHVRSSLIVASAIPVSVVTTFGVMQLADMTLNMISMAGLALSIGMLVDNSIVVLESIFRLREEGKSPWQAAIEGTRSVAMAVTASTLTTIAVFLPVLFVPGIAGVMFRDMSLIICFALGVSLAVSLTLVPLLASRLLVSGKAAGGLTRALHKDILARPRAGYGRALRWSLAHRKWVGAAVGGMLALVGVLAAFMPTEFMHEDDNAMVYIGAEAAVGSNLAESYALLREVVARAEKVIAPEERKLVALDVGVGKGFVAIFGKGVHAGNVRVPLVQVGKRGRSQQQIEAVLREELRDIPGLKATVAQPFNPVGGAGDVEVQIRGHDLETSRSIGLELRRRMLELPEVASADFSMDDQKPEVRVRFRREKLAELGLSSAAAGQAINAMFMGKVAGRFEDGGDEYDIVVRYAKDFRTDIDELRRAPIVGSRVVVVPLANVADIDVGLGPTDITRLDQARLTRLNVTLKPTWIDADGNAHIKDLGGAIGRVEELLAAYDWQDGFHYEISGTAEDFQKSFKYLGLALLIAVLLVYMVMAAQFESFREPFIIMFTVPLAVVGVVPMFTLTGSSLDVAALIGGVMLVGIVVNNGIVLVDAANQLRAQYHDRFEAVWQAAQQRLRPVLLTALTTCVAMVPMALGIGEGSAGWEGLAKAVIGGLTAATFLTLFVVPTIYTVFSPKVYKPPIEEDLGPKDARIA